MQTYFKMQAAEIGSIGKYAQEFQWGNVAKKCTDQENQLRNVNFTAGRECKSHTLKKSEDRKKITRNATEAEQKDVHNLKRVIYKRKVVAIVDASWECCASTPGFSLPFPGVI